MAPFENPNIARLEMKSEDLAMLNFSAFFLIVCRGLYWF